MMMFSRGFWSTSTARCFAVAVVCACAFVFPVQAAQGADVVQIDAAGYRNVQNLGQLALAMHNFEDVQGSLPGQYLQSSGAPGLSWRVTILPYLGYQSLYNSFDLSKPWNQPASLPLLAQMPDVYRSPADAPGATVTRYVVGTGTNLIFNGPTGVRSSTISDGTSNTILIGEAAASTFWTRPDDIAIGATPMLGGVGFSSSVTPDYTPLAFADASVHFLSNDIPSQTLLDLFTKNDGHVIDPATVRDYVVVPEPAALALCSLTGLMLRRRRGKRA
jgi:hypothetical protein